MAGGAPPAPPRLESRYMCISNVSIALTIEESKNCQLTFFKLYRPNSCGSISAKVMDVFGCYCIVFGYKDDSFLSVCSILLHYVFFDSFRELELTSLLVCSVSEITCFRVFWDAFRVHLNIQHNANTRETIFKHVHTYFQARIIIKINIVRHVNNEQQEYFLLIVICCTDDRSTVGYLSPCHYVLC
jgi:hypothetical protein